MRTCWRIVFLRFQSRGVVMVCNIWNAYKERGRGPYINTNISMLSFLSAVKFEVAVTSEASVNSYQTARHHMPKDNIFLVKINKT
jgi:hypothetical protein